MRELLLMDLKTQINSIINDIESLNIERDDVDFDDEDYMNCLNHLGEAADYLYGVLYYLEKHE